MPVPNSKSSLQHFTQWNLQQGLFFDRNKIDIPPGGCQSCSNVIFLDGVIRPRPGLLELYAPFPSTEPLVHIGETYPVAPEQPRLILVYRNSGTGDLTFYERVSGAWVLRTSAPLITMAEGDIAQSVNFNGGWFFIGGGSHDLAYMPTTGTAVDFTDAIQPDIALQCPDQPKVLASLTDRLIVANFINPDTGQRDPGGIAWSDHLEAFTWGTGVGAGTANRTKLGVGSTPITAIHTYGDVVTVFKPREVYLGKFVGGGQTLSYSLQVDGPGCVSARTLARYKDGKFLWLGTENVYMTRPGELPQPIGEPIKNRIRQIVDLENIEKSFALCDRDDDIYWLFMPKISDSQVKVVFGCNLRQGGAWFEGEIEMSDSLASSGEQFDTTWVKKQLLGSSGGKLYHYDFDTVNDDGSAFTCDWTSGVFSGELLTKAQNQQVVVEQARVYTDVVGAEVDLTVYTGNSMDHWHERDFGTQVFSGEDTEDNTHPEKTRSGEFFYLRFSFLSTATAAHIQGVTLGIIFGGDTR